MTKNRRQTQHRPAGETKIPKKRDMEVLKSQNQQLRRENARLRKRVVKSEEKELYTDTDPVLPSEKQVQKIEDLGPRCEKCGGTTIQLELGIGNWSVCQSQACLWRKRI